MNTSIFANRHFGIVLGGSLLGIASVACSGSGDGTKGSAQDISAGPPTAASASPAAPAASSASSATASTPSAPGSPTTLFSCKGEADPTSSALLTVDAAFHFVWQLSDNTASTTLTGVSVLDSGGYEFDTSSGAFLSLDTQDADMDLSLGGLDVQCDPASIKFDKPALDALVQATNDSAGKQRTFATCTAGDPADGNEAGTFTFRPALGGTPGAIIESSANDEGFVLFVSSEAADTSGKTTYTGEGGVTIIAAGQHTKSFPSMISAGAAGAATLTWNVASGDGTLDPIVSTGCTIQGEPATKNLVAH